MKICIWFFFRKSLEKNSSFIKI